VQEMNQTVLRWEGPFSFSPSADRPCILGAVSAEGPGVYLWALPVDGRYLVNYVGITAGSVAARQDEHVRLYLSGKYTIYNPKDFAQARKTRLFDPLDGLAAFLSRYVEISQALAEYLKMIHVFFAPLKVEKVLLERIESALIEAIRNAGGPAATFLDNARISRWTPPERKVPISIMQSPVFDGVPDELRV